VDFVTENIVLIAIAFVSGAMLLWPMLARQAAGPSLDNLGATRLINDTGAVVLDVRPAAEFDTGHLPGARNIPVTEFDKRAGEVPAGKPVIVCCASGANSARVAASLRKAGRQDVFNLSGGLRAWSQGGLPLVK
jgi:rhodanese-related sulfurtransferase